MKVQIAEFRPPNEPSFFEVTDLDTHKTVRIDTHAGKNAINIALAQVRIEEKLQCEK